LGFEFDRAGEQDVVLLVDMLVHVPFERREAVQRLERKASRATKADKRQRLDKASTPSRQQPTISLKGLADLHRFLLRSLPPFCSRIPVADLARAPAIDVGRFICACRASRPLRGLAA
jgi:hypothetical protein